MKKGIKKVFLVTSGLLLTGLLLCFIALASVGFDFRRLNAEKITSKTYAVEESFHAVSFNGSACDVTLLPSQDESCRVSYQESQTVGFTVTVEDEVLKITQRSDRKWTDNLVLSWGNYDVVAYLPKKVFSSLQIQTHSGDVHLSSVQCATLTATSESGEIELTDVRASGELRLQTHSGDVELDRCNGESISVTVGSGEIELTDVRTSGELQLETSSGDIEFSRCDGGSVFIKTGSGNVEGSLLSGKLFTVSTEIGNAIYPQSSGTSPCNIQTGSGDVYVTVRG